MLIQGPEFQFVAGLVTGLSGGLLSGLFGVGGGIILIPMLKLALGLDQHHAQGVALAALILPNGLPAMIHYRRHGIVVLWGLVGVLILGFLPGIWVGAVVAGKIPEGPLRWIFVGFLILLAIRTSVSRPDSENVALAPEQPTTAVSPWKGVLVGVVGGLFAGLLGIGGGVVMIPLLTIWLRLPQHQAQLTSLAVLLPPIGLPGLLVYAHGSSNFPWLVLYGLVLGFLLGTYLGARLATNTSGPRLRKAFAGLMLLTASLMMWKG